MTVHPIYTEGDFLDRVTEVYRAVVSEADPTDGTTKLEAQLEAITRLRDMVEGGDLAIPLDFALRRAVDRVDESDGKKADKVIESYVHGQPALDIEDDSLDTVVVLGYGKRKPLRHLRDEDLRDMDANRFQNLRNAQNAYAEWRDIYEPTLRAVVRYGTFGAAVCRGAFQTQAKAAS